MCGIAGILYRDGGANGAQAIGRDMTKMLQSMKHRGPDSTGYALYGQSQPAILMRYKLADANTPRDFEFDERLARPQRGVLARLAAAGAKVLDVREDTEYAYRVTLDYDADFKELADR